MSNAPLFGLAIGLTALAWSLSRTTAKGIQLHTREDWKHAISDLLFSILVALFIGIAGAIFWKIGQEVVPKLVVPEKITIKKGRTPEKTPPVPAISTPPITVAPNMGKAIQATPAPEGDAPVNIGLSKENEQVTQIHANKFAKKTGTDENSTRSTKSATEELEPDTKEGNTLTPEVWLAIGSLVIAIVTGVYLVAIQNTLQAGKELVKDMVEQRKQFEKELKGIAQLKRSRSELASGIAESLNCTMTLIAEISSQLQQRLSVNDPQKLDYENIDKSLNKFSKELEWVTRTSTFTSFLNKEKFGLANLAAAQFTSFLASTSNPSYLTQAIVHDLLESLQRLRSENADLFNNRTLYPNLPELLDKLIEFSA